MNIILEVKNLKISFETYRGEVKALDGVNLKIFEGEVLALVGESGCGKSVTALSILGLLPDNAIVKGGEILFNGDNLLNKTKEELRMVRAKDIAAVFQDPMTYLNPVLNIATQLEEVIEMQNDLLKRAYGDFKVKDEINLLKLIKMRNGFNKLIKMPKREVKKLSKMIAIELLKLVRLADPERILKAYPFELSGGMRQRVMIAMAIIRKPSIFIADEITTALDVTIQAQILQLLKELKDKVSTSTLLITHDLSVAAEISDRISVMYAGRVVESAKTTELFKNPLHPYTKLLLKAIPKISESPEKLEHIPGTVPDLVNPPKGCRFHPRCPFVMDVCKKERPNNKEVEEGHETECHLY